MGRWGFAPILSVLVVTGLVALVGLMVSHLLTISALGLGIALLLWERYQLFRAMRGLARQLQAGHFDSKLEVGTGAWGEVCHAINRIMQQWRAEQHMQRLQPAQPALRQTNQLSLYPPVDGRVSPVAVLAVRRLAIADPLTEIRARVHFVREAVERQQALIQWSDDHVLLIFGALVAESDPIRPAIAAVETITNAALTTGLPLPPFALCVGGGRVAVAPLLGLYVTGAPIEQASLLVRQSRPALVMCSEEASRQLRNAGILPPPNVRLITATRTNALALGTVSCQHQPE
ncbi:MAG: DUF3329 domain-containing protein [Chloroflexus sp.]